MRRDGPRRVSIPKTGIRPRRQRPANACTLASVLRALFSRAEMTHRSPTISQQHWVKSLHPSQQGLPADRHSQSSGSPSSPSPQPSPRSRPSGIPPGFQPRASRDSRLRASPQYGAGEKHERRRIIGGGSLTASTFRRGALGSNGLTIQQVISSRLRDYRARGRRFNSSLPSFKAPTSHSQAEPHHRRTELRRALRIAPPRAGWLLPSAIPQGD